MLEWVMRQLRVCTQVFLMSLKAGGVALNLTAASHVMLMDPWWNPAVEQQARSFPTSLSTGILSTSLLHLNFLLSTAAQRYMPPCACTCLAALSQRSEACINVG